jgi:hypothetical protein
MMTETTNAKRMSPSVARGLPLRRKLDEGRPVIALRRSSRHRMRLRGFRRRENLDHTVDFAYLELRQRWRCNGHLMRENEVEWHGQRNLLSGASSHNLQP